MESGIKRTQRDYSLAFKLSVAQPVEKGEMSYREAQRRFGIQGTSTVLTWLLHLPLLRLLQNHTIDIGLRELALLLRSVLTLLRPNRSFVVVAPRIRTVRSVEKLGVSRS